MNARSDSAKRLTALTDRRREVAILACQGLSNRQIAEKLSVTEGTVKTHLHAIFEKLDIHSRTEAIGRRRGIIAKKKIAK
jgi:DNA-binding NarL/FixJ family response regulator